MNKHNHHHCECKHERLSFCGKCKVPHCLDCGKQWEEPCQRSHGYTYYPYVGNTTSAFPQITWTSETVCNDATTVLTCAHQ